MKYQYQATWIVTTDNLTSLTVSPAVPSGAAENIFFFLLDSGRGHTKETGNRNATAISEKFHGFQAGNWFPD
jgi:hypothetical protein